MIADRDLMRAAREAAEADLISFFREMATTDQTVNACWRKAAQEVASIPAAPPNLASMEVDGFLNVVLTWMEEHGRFPVTNGLNREGEAMGLFSDLLILIRKRLTYLQPPAWDELDDDALQAMPACVAAFADTAAGSVRSALSVPPDVAHSAFIDRADGPLPDGFRSFLVVDRAMQHLQIIYDEERIKQLSGGDEKKTAQMTARCALHELGHARSHIDFFYDPNEPDASRIFSLPCHESLAWAYAMMVLAEVCCFRARIDRHLGSADSE